MFGGVNIPKKQPKKKWNRHHEFQWKKETKTTKRHPAYVYGTRGQKNRYLLFTHSSSTNGEENEKLNHNINPNETDKSSYVRKKYFVSPKSEFEKPSEKFRIHDEDKHIIKKYGK